MANPWLRLWNEMPTDPKWRTISRISKQPISVVMAVYIHMLVEAANATERGRTHANNCEHIACSLDVETADVEAIRTAMQGRVLAGDVLSGWAKRQPQREDNAADRAKEWRDKQKAERNRTQPNAEEHQSRVEESRVEESTSLASPATRSATNIGKRFSSETIPDDFTAFSVDELGWTTDRTLAVFANFRDYWTEQPGARGRKVNWLGTWRNWCRKEVEDEAKALQRNGNHSQAGLYESATDRSIRVAKELVIRDGRL